MVKCSLMVNEKVNKQVEETYYSCNVKHKVFILIPVCEECEEVINKL